MSRDRLTNATAQLLVRVRNRHFFLLDLIVLFLLPFAALWLRTDNAYDDGRYLVDILLYALLTLPIWMVVLVRFSLYSLNWQYASLLELSIILQAVLVATILSALAFFLVLRPLNLISPELPRSLPVIVALFGVLALVGTRYSVRFMEYLRRQRQFAGRSYKQVVIVGAGGAGAMIAREMLANPQLGLSPIAFLDDDAKKHRTFIHGVPVLGGLDALPMVVRECHAEEAIIAMPTASGKLIRQVAAQCLKNNLIVKTVPGMLELLDGSVTVNKLRDVEIDDLLRREPVTTEIVAVAELLRGKRILVTGAGGSIGSEICRQVVRCAPAQLVLMGHGENSLFMIGNELRTAHPEMRIEAVVADVRSMRRVSTVLERFQPELIFHAAAHKHVSLMETNIEDAVTNNVLGTRVMVDAAIANGVETFVMISTDKAVNPVSVMGATKRVAELYVHARALQTGMRYVVVRFGNVLGSRGSVVPLFKQQIARGGPVLVTHPDVRRFFMTIPEAVQLVLQAATLGRGGEIFALDMGEPIRIVDLAQDLIRLSGLQVGRDIDIEFTGLRPGEKLYEEVFVPGEAYERTTSPKIFVARNGAQTTRAQHRELFEVVERLIVDALEGNGTAARKRLELILPEFQRKEQEEGVKEMEGWREGVIE